MPSERQYRREMVVFGQMLHQRGYVAATDGNLSARLSDGRIVVTPTGMSKSMLRASDMVVVDLEGRRLAGKRNVSSELAMHLLIYRLAPRHTWESCMRIRPRLRALPPPDFR